MAPLQSLLEQNSNRKVSPPKPLVKFEPATTLLEQYVRA
jgi:hypothetical protein